MLVSFTPTREYNSVVVSTPDVKKGSTYTLTTGDSSTTIEMSDIIYGESIRAELLTVADKAVRTAEVKRPTAIWAEALATDRKAKLTFSQYFHTKNRSRSHERFLFLHLKLFFVFRLLKNLEIIYKNMKPPHIFV